LYETSRNITIDELFDMKKNKKIKYPTEYKIKNTQILNLFKDILFYSWLTNPDDRKNLKNLKEFFDKIILKGIEIHNFRYQ
jgi:hypothetical protein